MTLVSTFFLVDFEPASETIGEDGPAFARTVERVRDDAGSRFVGGRIRAADDVERAVSCGVHATDASSAALGADDREAWLRTIAAAVPTSLE